MELVSKALVDMCAVLAQDGYKFQLMLKNGNHYFAKEGSLMVVDRKGGVKAALMSELVLAKMWAKEELEEQNKN